MAHDNEIFEIKPLGDRVIVRAQENVESVKNGIVIPAAHKERPMEGTVIAVGETAKKVRPGDQVFYGKYAGSEVTVDDVKYLVMNEEDIIGIRRTAAEMDMGAQKNGYVETTLAGS